MDDTFETIFEEQFEFLPEEVKDFLLGDSFASTIEEIKKMLPVEQERLSLQKDLLLFLAGGRTMDELGATIEELTVPEEIRTKIISLIKEKVVDEILLSLEVLDEIENSSTEPSPQKEGDQSAPSPAQVLESLKSRLTQANTVAPIARDHTLTKQKEQSETEKPSIDPYRELPQ